MLCKSCKHLISEGCVPFCNKGRHKDYEPVTNCEEFVDKEKVKKAKSKIETILFEADLNEKEKEEALKEFI